mmetsp:Transcript_34738/g.79247  ORF Transcript_34738/g.79247 Transcript_34738/m.79247 type:complete len:455 (+) Transcript_34738:93-1457(+)
MAGEASEPLLAHPQSLNDEDILVDVSVTIPGWARWGGWTVAALFYLYDVMCRLSVNVVEIDVQRNFDIGAGTVSAVFGSSFFYGYAAVQLWIGFALDGLGPKRTIFLSAMLSCGGTFLFGIAHTVWLGTLARVISGIGCGCGWLGAIKVCRNSFGTDSHTARIMIATTCALGGLGGLVSQRPFALLVDSCGWRTSFQILAIAPAAIAFAALIFVRDVAEPRNDEAGAPLSGSRAQGVFQSLKTVAKTPRIWLYALYLGGTDAPFETIAGLFGVSCLEQAFNWTEPDATTATTVLVIVATVSQLAAGPVLGFTPKLSSKLAVLIVLSSLGVVSLLPFVVHATATTITLYAGIVALGVMVGSTTIIWAIISSDSLCAGTRSTGLVSGATNTLVIAIDAIVQNVVGLILGANFHGQYDPSGARVYDAGAYAQAFSVLMAVLVMATVSVVAVLVSRKC